MIGRLKHLLKPLPDFVSVEKRKVKYARIQVLPTGEVRMVVPKRCSAAQVYGLYEEKRTWIDRKREQYSLSQQQAFKLKDDELLLFGKAYSLRIDTLWKTPRIDHDAQVIISARNLLDETVSLLWYKNIGKEYFSERLALLASQHGFDYNRLTIRSQKTRWGSCSVRKNISLNWKLIKSPVFVSDYVILHELLHTEIMNHSADFWLGMMALDPDYKKAKDWLKEFGPYL